MKQSIDIEQLVTWAYRDELSKRVTSSAESIWNKLSDWRMLAAPIDLGYGHGPQRYDLGTPHPDALVIEKAVASLPDAVIDWQGEAVFVLGDLLALVTPIAEENAPAGSAVSRRTMVSWSSRGGAKVRAELEPPRRVIMVRSLRTPALVTMHAAMATVPDWMPEPPHPRYVPATRGPGPQIYGECRGRNVYSVGSYCPLRWEPSVITIAEARADYLAWWRGLDRLALMLANELTKFFPQRPAAFEMPWHMPPVSAPWGRPRAVRRR